MTGKLSPCATKVLWEFPRDEMGVDLEKLSSKAATREEKLCQGTLLSPLQYEIDVELWGYQDARLSPKGSMTAHLKTGKGKD